MYENLPTTEGVRETVAHADRMVDRRDRIQASIEDSFDVVVARVGREPCSPAEAAELVRWARTIGVKRSTGRMIEALRERNDYDAHTLFRWVREGVGDDEPLAPGCETVGVFPMLYQRTPPRGVPCVYLLTIAGRVVYIGYSQNVKDRLRSHWRERKETGLDGWHIRVCSTAREAFALEGDLIYQYQPEQNYQGRASRRHATI